MTGDNLDGWDPQAPDLILVLLEDFLAFGVAVLGRTQSGAPQRKVIDFAQPVDEADQIAAYGGVLTHFPDFQRADRKTCAAAPKAALFLRWNRCMTPSRRGEAPSVSMAHDDVAVLQEDGWRMWQSAVRCWNKNRLFERYSVECEHVQLSKLTPIARSGDIAGWQLNIEVELNASQRRPTFPS